MDIFNIILNGPTQYCHGINGVNISYFWNAWLNHTVHPASVGLFHISPKFVYRSTYVAALTDTVIDVLVKSNCNNLFSITIWIYKALIGTPNLATSTQRKHQFRILKHFLQIILPIQAEFEHFDCQPIQEYSCLILVESGLIIDEIAFSWRKYPT